MTTIMGSNSNNALASTGGSNRSGGQNNFRAADSNGVVLQGYHKKLKTMRKKYFVLCAETGTSSARLEYYDNEKKFKSRSHPKRTIILKNCFNINRRLDTKHKFVIALSTKEEGFCIVLDSEQELNIWLRALLALQRGEDTESEPPKPNFEHVWQVQVQRKGLAEERGIIGSYHVCLTTKSLTLFRIGSPTTTFGENRLISVEFYLTTIRRCGDSQCFFYMEVGRHSAIGAGELWMETEDTLIAQNMHTIIISAMSSSVKNRDDSFGPMRNRSFSATEASKPISVMNRRQTLSGNKPMNSSSPFSESPNATASTLCESAASTVIQVPITVHRNAHHTQHNVHQQQKQQQQQQQKHICSPHIIRQNSFESKSSVAAAAISNCGTSNCSNITPTQTNQQNQYSGTTNSTVSSGTTNFSNQTTASSSVTTPKNQQNDMSIAVLPPASNCCTTPTTPAVITSTSCNPQYPFTAPLKPLIGGIIGFSQRRHSVSVSAAAAGENIVTGTATVPSPQPSSSSSAAPPKIIHHRTLSLPNGGPLHSAAKNSTQIYSNDSTIVTNNSTMQIQPVHQRTRSLPLTEETAIQFHSLQPLNSAVTASPLRRSVVSSAFNQGIGSWRGSSNFAYNNNNNSNINNNHISTPKRKNSLTSCHVIISSGDTEMNNNYACNNNGNNSSHYYVPIIGGTNSMESITEDPLSVAESSAIVRNIQNFIIKNAMKCTGKIPQTNNSNSLNNSGSVVAAKTSGGSPLMRKGGVGRNNRTTRSTTLGRERCDSLPSRNRTASECSNQSLQHNHNITSMPPPRLIPSLANRPHSMYTNRHSHSPPMNTLSPSTGCSESDGSSLSIDETDSFGLSMTPDDSGNFVNRYYPRTSKVIPEENVDDYWYPENKSSSPIISNIPSGKVSMRTGSNDRNQNGSVGAALSLPIGTNQITGRKGSPASHVGSADAQSQYMDMCSPYSPCSSSPCDQTGSGYIPISPGVEYQRSIYPGSSGGHSRASSLAEETVDGYVPMGPPQSQDYVDMEQTQKQNQSSNLSSAASSCSITSGTPSTDLRFAEYPLDKVKSRFTPDDEEVNTNNERPTRAYSVGSRMEHNKRKLRVDVIAAEQSNARVRAFSVGSRAKVPRSDLFRGVFAPYLTSCHINNNSNINNNTNNNNIAHIDPPSSNCIISSASVNASGNGKGKKSASAPILVHKSHSSVDRMSDLMEIDFSKNSPTSSSSEQTETPPRVKSSPVRIPTSTLTATTFPVQIPSSSSRVKYNSEPAPFSGSPRISSGFMPGYVEMRPGSNSEKCSSASRQRTEDGYLEMKPVGLSKSPSLSSSPIKIITSPKTTFNKREQQRSVEYMNMSPCSVSSFPPTNRVNSEDYINVSPVDKRSGMMSASSNEKMDVDVPPAGYMEMAWKRPEKPLTQQPQHKKMMPRNNQTSPESQIRVTNLPTSSPIDIKPKSKGLSGLSLTDMFSKSRKRADSKSSSEVTTPSTGPSTIFPFSPGSPMKSFVSSNDFTQRKCLVDATSGSVNLSDDRLDAITQMQIDSGYFTGDSSCVKSFDSTKILNTDPVPVKVEKLSNDYADMSLGSSKTATVGFEEGSVTARACTTNISQSSEDYVNFLPSASTQTSVVIKPVPIAKSLPASDDVAGEYAIMNPSVANLTSTVAPTAVVAAGAVATQSPTKKKPLTVTLSGEKPVFEGFKPIASSTEDLFLRTGSGSSRKGSSPKPGNSTSYLLKRQVSEKSTNKNSSATLNEQAAGYELLHMRSESSIQTKKVLSRPNSVNSDKFSPSKSQQLQLQQHQQQPQVSTSRPNSANSEFITSSISTSSSTSTLCGGGSSSSSSTLCGSKSQSPLATSRPQSFADNSNCNEQILQQLSGNQHSQQQLISSRPPSVSSERELHYASLDLPLPALHLLEGSNVQQNCTTKIFNNSCSNGTESSSSTSPSPSCNVVALQQPLFTYAQIDFNKCEMLKLQQQQQTASNLTPATNNN